MSKQIETKKQWLVISATNTQQSSEASRKAEWAVMVDVSQPLSDFHQQVPSMAFTWPFELDTFQKQAVLRLERNESVFVAAHTSGLSTNAIASYLCSFLGKRNSICQEEVSMTNYWTKLTIFCSFLRTFTFRGICKAFLRGWFSFYRLNLTCPIKKQRQCPQRLKARFAQFDN